MNMSTRVRALSTVVLVGSAFLIGVATAHPFQSGDTARAAARQVRDAQLVSSTAGWVLTATGLVRTDDAGVSWRSILPPSVAPKSVVSVFFLDPLRGWVIVRGAAIGTPPGVALTAYRTVDGGSTWLGSVVGKTAYGNPVNPTLTFDDALNGWLDWGLEGSRRLAGSQLLVTSDAGVTWTERKSPIRGRVVGSPQRLWIAGSRAGSSELYTSIDVGLSWQRVQLPLPSQHAKSSIVIDRILAVDANRATVSVSYTGHEEPGVGIYTTIDGGLSWSVVADVPTSVRIAEDVSAATAIPDANTVVVVLPKGDVAYVARGTTVTQVTPVGLVAGVFKLSFADAAFGWALTFAEGPDNGRLFATRDGARTWRELSP